MHRVVDGLFVQGGDFVFGNGSGGESIYNGKKFKDEKAGLMLNHDRKGVVSMGNSGKNANTSQFFITFKAVPQCDGKHVVFGEVVSGFDVIDALGNVQTGSGDDKPMAPIKITNCGRFNPLHTPGSGYWYDQPDPESFTGTTSIFIVRPRVAIVAKKGVCDKFVHLLGDHVCAITVQLNCKEEDDMARQQVYDLLESFSIDMAIVAPACADAFEDFKIPISWSAKNGSGEDESKEDVLIISKPVDALQKIKRQLVKY